MHMHHDTGNADIDALLRRMAKEDGYDARKLWHTDRLLRDDTLPSEQERIECVERDWKPITWPETFARVVIATLGTLTAAGAVWFIWYAWRVG